MAGCKSCHAYTRKGEFKNMRTVEQMDRVINTMERTIGNLTNLVVELSSKVAELEKERSCDDCK